jgi:hypothetical protein
MATVAEVMDEAARECSITPPASWITATTLSHVELKGFLRQTTEELLDRIDWPDPIAQDQTITGDGSAAYTLNADFKRLTRDPLAVYETTGTRRAGIPVHSNGVWTVLLQDGSAGGNRYYRTSGDEESGYEIEFFDAPATGIEIKVSFISKNWLKTTGTPSTTWTTVNDTLLLPRALIEMGVVWRFRRRKGLPYADRMAEYEGKLARLANDARLIRSIDMTGGATRRSPFDIPVPDSIPSS